MQAKAIKAAGIAAIFDSAQWEFPLFMPLGVIAPNDPIKEVVISE